MTKVLQPITVHVETLISANKYCVDESNKHIEPVMLEDTESVAVREPSCASSESIV